MDSQPAKESLVQKIVRVALYARFSSKNQSRESADDQIKRMRKYVAAKTLPLVKYCGNEFVLEIVEEWVIKDEAISGKIADRKGFERIKAGVRTKSFDLLVTDDLSRITRELGDQLEFYKMLWHHNVELVSICDHASSHMPNSKTIFTFKGMINDWSNESHAERTKRGLEVRAIEGFSAGNICYGYTSTSSSTRRTGGYEVPCNFELSINPIEAEAINLAFDLKVDGFGYSEIARKLTKANYPSTSATLLRTKLDSLKGMPVGHFMERPCIL